MSDPSPQLIQALGQGLAALQAGAWSSALLNFRQVLTLDPEQPDAWCNLAIALRELGRPDEALAASREAMRVAPDSLPARLGYATCLLACRQPGAALPILQDLAHRHGNDPILLSTLAGALHALGRDGEALEADQRALEAAPQLPALHLNLGYALMRTGRLEEAERRFQGVLARGGNPARARWNLAYTRLLQGRLREAWPHFACRLETPEARENLRPFPQAPWDGKPFPGKTLLVWGEQGFGDAFMAARFLPRVKALGGHVILLSYEQALPILRTAGGADAWIPEGGTLPPFDLQVPLLSLPALLGLEAADLTPPHPYLTVPKDHQPPETLRQALDGASGRRRIGLAWAGNPHHVEDRRRSLDPSLLAHLAGLEGITWFSLQIGAAIPPALPGLVDLAPHVRDFRDTAWILERLDALVTVDTAVAHLAGALGRPVHLLLPYFPDWRWGWSGSDTPWYPGMTLHRQPQAGAWEPVLASLHRALA